MSYPADVKTFGADEHKKRLSDALRRRLYPNTGLHPKMVAHALGISTETVLNWASGQNDPSSYRLGELMAFFSWANDFTFWAEVYGPIGEQMHKRFAEKQRQREIEREAESRHLNLLTGVGE